MLNTMTLSISGWLSHTKSNKNGLDKDGGSGIGGGRIGDRIANLSSTIKKMSSKAGFFTFQASLAFIQLRKIFNETPILHYFDLEHHI